MMKKCLFVFLVLVLSVNLCLAAEGDKKVSPEEKISPTEQMHADIKLPSKDSTEYWIIRSQSITELIPFLTKKRTEMKGNLKLFTDYLMVIDKGEAFVASDLEVKFTPTIYAKALGIYDELESKGVNFPDKLLTWDQTVEFAMRFVLQEGYMPVDIDGKEELDMYKKICMQKEKYGVKVQKEVRQILNKCVRVWTYLGTIEKQSAFRVFAYQEKEAKELARKERLAEGRAGLAAARDVRQRDNAIAKNQMRLKEQDANLQLRREALAANERLRSQQMSAQERAALQQQQQRNYIHVRGNTWSTRYRGHY